MFCAGLGDERWHHRLRSQRTCHGRRVMRGTSVCMTDPGCAGHEPEPLAQKLPTSLMTLVMWRSFSCFCASGGGNA